MLLKEITGWIAVIHVLGANSLSTNCSNFVVIPGHEDFAVNLAEKTGSQNGSDSWNYCRDNVHVNSTLPTIVGSDQTNFLCGSSKYIHWAGFYQQNLTGLSDKGWVWLDGENDSNRSIPWGINQPDSGGDCTLGVNCTNDFTDAYRCAKFKCPLSSDGLEDAECTKTYVVLCQIKGMELTYGFSDYYCDQFPIVKLFVLKDLVLTLRIFVQSLLLVMESTRCLTVSNANLGNF
jgi:hypothetical protein